MSNASLIDDDARASAAPKRPGRPPTRPPAREPSREPSRDGAVILGRNGEQLSRSKRADSGDPFHVPPEFMEPGWDYQWITETVVNSPDAAMRHRLNMITNGWRAVPHSRMPGVYGPEGASGAILIEGQGLYERPMKLSEDARAEDIEKAKRQLRDRDEALMGGKAAMRQAMQNGFSMENRYRGTGGQLRMNIDPALDIPAPQHTLAEPGE